MVLMCITPPRLCYYRTGRFQACRLCPADLLCIVRGWNGVVIDHGPLIHGRGEVVVVVGEDDSAFLLILNLFLYIHFADPPGLVLL
jgi:hypothetical protein